MGTKRHRLAFKDSYEMAFGAIYRSSGGIISFVKQTGTQSYKDNELETEMGFWRLSRTDGLIWGVVHGDITLNVKKVSQKKNKE
jgi:hypothetical protein